ncbi:MAG: VOC family protein [Deltaproteobacteria bacterium]|nr:VOC family protein [Deltaproteobacteria bacterium]
MKLNHLQVSTHDVDASTAFYERFFGFKKGWEADGETFLVREADEDGFLLALRPVEQGPEPPEWLHFGFTVDTIAEVKERHAVLEAAGIAFAMAILDRNDMAVFYALDPGSGNRVEVGCWSPA